MKLTNESRLMKAVVIVAVFGVMTANVNIANAATKTITCYKGTVVKKVTTAKCPTGYSTKKPVAPVTAKPTVKASTPAASGSKTVAYSGTFTGTVAGSVTASDLQATVKGEGKGDVAGLDTLAGSGSASGCDSFSDSGTLSGGGNSLKFEVKSTSKACGDAAAGDNMNLTGDLVITGGTGKYVGATGTLKVKGAFVLKSTTEGSNFTSPFTATISGTITTK
jgi:hypothetical protein